MALFSAFMKEYRTAQRQSQAQRGIATPTSGQLSDIEGYIGGQASAEVRGGMAETSREQRGIEREAEQERFGGEMGLRREGLALEKKRTADEQAIARSRLALEERGYKKSKSMMPYALGLGVADVGLAGWGSYQQRQRDTEYSELLKRILGRRSTPGSDYHERAKDIGAY